MFEHRGNQPGQPLFVLGRVLATQRVLAELSREDLAAGLRRHQAGDWGNLCDEDKKTNDDAVKHGYRILSAYQASSGEKFWIITESDRSVTTILFPDEY